MRHARTSKVWVRENREETRTMLDGGEQVAPVQERLTSVQCSVSDTHDERKSKLKLEPAEIKWNPKGPLCVVSITRLAPRNTLSQKVALGFQDCSWGPWNAEASPQKCQQEIGELAGKVKDPGVVKGSSQQEALSGYLAPTGELTLLLTSAGQNWLRKQAGLMSQMTHTWELSWEGGGRPGIGLCRDGWGDCFIV